MNEITQFLSLPNTGPDLIPQYYAICNKVLFYHPDIIKQIANKLIHNITNYATIHSPVYSSIQNMYSRTNLKKELWFVESLKRDNQLFHTSGSSSGEPFSYGVYRPHIDFLEDECHYGMILDEFGITKKNPRILILKKLAYNPHHVDFIYEQKEPSPYTLHTHKSIDSTRYFVRFDDYMENPSQWIEKLLLHIRDLVPFDIVMITGPIMSFLSHYLVKHNIQMKIGYLFSQTGEFMRQSDRQIMLDGGYANYVCDHMRCWDGGATFFTCKYHTYHLLDNLSWVTQGPDNKMISTDYFNMSAPFINYWNGDLCEIENNYKLCECGRYYRPFKMLANRPFALKGPTKLTEIKKQIGVLEYKGKIDQVQFENLSANIYIKDKLSDDEKQTLQHIVQDYKINFYE